LKPRPALPAGRLEGKFVRNPAIADEQHETLRVPVHLMATAVLALTVLSYIPAIRGGFIWDDDAYVTRNDNLRDLQGLRNIWTRPDSIPQWYPVTHTTFWAEYHLWKLDPFGYHLVNVLLHASSAVLLLVLLRRLNVPGGPLAAVIFAVHPVHVESVAWITERKNVLASVFYLASMLMYLRFQPLDGQAGKRRWRFYGLSFLFFLLAMGSKSVVATLPAALLVLLWWKGRKLTWKTILPLVPMFLAGVIYGSYTAWLETEHVGARGEEWSLSIVERFLLAGRALWFYAAKLLVPYKLSFNYPRWNVNAGVWWQYLFPLGAVGIFVALWISRWRIGKGPLAAVLLFAGTLFPALGFLNVYPMRFSYVADHFQYPASAAVIALFSAAVAFGIRRTKGNSRYAAWGGCVLAVVVLAALTARQSRIYKNQETLWRETIRANPRSWFAMGNLGDLLQRRGELVEAVHWRRRALEVRGDVSEAHAKLGKALLAQGRISEAIEHLRRAAELDPDSREAHGLLAEALLRDNRRDQALAHYREYGRLLPQRSRDICEFADYLAGRGFHEEAIRQYRKAIELDRSNAGAYLGLGNVLFQRRAMAQAAGYYRRALEITPNLAEARARLGAALLEKGAEQEAAEQLRAALKLQPGNPMAKITLAWLLATARDGTLRDGTKAVELARQMCKRTNYRKHAFLDVLAAAFAEKGDFGSAVATAKRAVALAEAEGDTQAARMYRGRLELYRNHRPYRSGALPVGRCNSTAGHGAATQP